jgi:hypothetical protein
MCKCGLNFQINLLHTIYNNQHFEPIEYTYDVRNIQFQSETQNSNIIYKFGWLPNALKTNETRNANTCPKNTF